MVGNAKTSNAGSTTGRTGVGGRARVAAAFVAVANGPRRAQNAAAPVTMRHVTRTNCRNACVSSDPITYGVQMLKMVDSTNNTKFCQCLRMPRSTREVFLQRRWCACGKNALRHRTNWGMRAALRNGGTEYQRRRQQPGNKQNAARQRRLFKRSYHKCLRQAKSSHVQQ